jgi:hypothetical protein
MHRSIRPFSILKPTLKEKQKPNAQHLIPWRADVNVVYESMHAVLQYHCEVRGYEWKIWLVVEYKSLIQMNMASARLNSNSEPLFQSGSSKCDLQSFAKALCFGSPTRDFGEPVDAQMLGGRAPFMSWPCRACQVEKIDPGFLSFSQALQFSDNSTRVPERIWYN